MAKVKNMIGTSDKKCKCDSWLAHWEAATKQTADWCGHHSCQEKKDLVGAHVKRTDISDTNAYIIPLCKYHNKQTDEFTVFTSYELIRDNNCK